MSYFIVPTKHRKDGLQVPDLPRRAVDYRKLLTPQHAAWSVGASYHLNQLKNELPPGVDRVGPDLENLLVSASTYPIALALTSDELRHGTAEMSREDFCLAAEQRLRHHYEQQAAAPYFLAKCVGSQTLHMANGCYHWILGYSRPPYGTDHDTSSVLALSLDEQIYSTPIDWWELRPQHFERLSKIS